LKDWSAFSSTVGCVIQQLPVPPSVKGFLCNILYAHPCLFVQLSNLHMKNISAFTPSNDVILYESYVCNYYILYSIANWFHSKHVLLYSSEVETADIL
jgi:hypothetical protein